MTAIHPPGCAGALAAPAAQQLVGQILSADECGTHMLAEHRRPMVATAGVATGQLSTVLPEPTP